MIKDIVGGVSPLKARQAARGGKYAGKATSSAGRRGGFAKSTGKRDSRFKVQGLTKDENVEYSQAAQKEKKRKEEGKFTQTEREQELHKLSKSEMTFDKWKADVIKREGADYLNSFTNEQIMQLKNPSALSQAKTLGGNIYARLRVR